MSIALVIGRTAAVLRDRRLGLRLLLAGYMVLFVARHLVVPFVDPPRPLAELPFGYGLRAHTLVETGTFAACGRSGHCSHATRMPLPILSLAGLRLVAGDDSGAVALAKGVLLDTLVLGALAVVFAGGISVAGAVVLLSCVAGPQFMLHARSVAYEEGFAIPLLTAAMALTLTLWGPEPPP
ncbi:hypothetical protein [Azospirillum halopraeferens]|uniref:hypothetical protein n=1 Tax=Azospirillum halopraeferens TaxID=34010 RepID=UPI00048E1331|nr:hypothetical protein [Azospirillum halopraeferens]